ncbi:HAD-IA family hydrolase [Sphingobium algorifonticola]|uniref:HAD family hydrolase n=1 Tax=Sphingobium algorifonticola TaxID=2008318 RepID=A0A437JDC1_9SPHN|nr:HAD-IA family hydrolase [Sphingobium algorifonticola]RVT43884.1 HAD family hydrolase [Sphingobium algorifonticola]
MNRPLALFDCDGTLVDSQHSICAAMVRAFDAARLTPPDRPTILSVVGLSLPHAMAKLLPDADDAFHHHIADQYRDAFRTMRTEGDVVEPLYDGIGDLLDRLSGQGWLLGVATGKSDRGLALCLTQHGIIDRFVTLQTADRHPSKPNPAMLMAAMAEADAAPETTVMIGDTTYDIDMAIDAGVRAIGVNWGYHSPAELLAAGATAVAVDSEDLGRHIGTP